uniref:Uncharacterized protein n=1 Tax=Ditylenchus dipsaci TaxID=166011 RepID=A0A915ELM2_9BILA
MCSSLAAVVSSPPSPPSITINTPNHIAAAAGHAPLDLSHAHPHLHSAKSNRLGRNNRRTSYLANRSSAVDQTSWTRTNLPRKQNSSPLPQKSQRIYDRSHINSRGRCCCSTIQLLHFTTSPPEKYSPNQCLAKKTCRLSAAYSQQFGSAKANSMCDPYVVSPPFSGKKHSAVLTPPSPYWTQRQAKSFDDRNYGQLSSISHLPPTRPRFINSNHNMTTI